jgi:hypothetical protein
MKIPINPQTAAPSGELNYERPVDVTAGVRALGEVVNKYSEYAAEEQKKQQLFTVQKMLVDETNNIQQDFEDKTKVQPLGAPNFTQQVAGEYNSRHQKMVQDLKSQGYGEDAVNEFATRLGSIRSQYVAKAIDFQEKSAFSKTTNDADQIVLGLSQYANSNPNAVGSALTQFRVALQLSGLDEVEQDQIYNAKKDIILQGAREGFATQHPEIVLGLFAPTEPVTTSPSTLPAGQTFDLPSYLRKTDNAEGSGKNPRSSAIGYFQFTDDTWTNTYKEVFGKTNETRAQILAKKKDKGTATKLMEKLTSDNIQALVNANKPVNNGTTYLAHFLGIGDAIKVLSAHADESVKGLISSKSIASNPDIFKKVHTAGDMIGWATAKMGVELPTPLKAIPPNWKGNVEDAIQELGMTADQAQEFLKTGKDTRVAGQVNTGGVGPTAPTATMADVLKESGITVDAEGKTGLPVLDLATGPERMQMLTLSRTIMNEREADAKSAQREAHQQWLNGFLNNLQDGKLGQADLDAAYTKGQFTDYDERMKAQNILDQKNKKDKNLVFFGDIINSGLKPSPFDNDAQNAVDAGFQKGVEDIVKNNKQISPFTYALHLWQRTGILPTKGAVMIRGGLIGTDPRQVEDAASVASNMLKENPNAFAGVEGGDDIGKAAANYTHYVDDLGMTSTQAAQKVALQNSPEFQVKMQADKTQRDQFASSIIGDKSHSGINIDKVINDQQLGSRGVLSHLTFGAFDPTRGSFTEPQRAEAKQTYLELALDHYDKYHDPAAAQAYAARQMGRFYGVEGNRLLKYPATKAYPEVMGSQEYIFDQAKEYVDKFAGFPVPKEDIFLQPTPSGSTAAAFRAGKAPPYEVHFITHENGQSVYHYIPGKVFVADLGEAWAKAAVEAKKQEVLTRQHIIYPGLGPIEELSHGTN